MNQGIDIHNRGRQIKWVNHALEQAAISRKNKELISDFVKAKRETLKEVNSDLREVKLKSRLLAICKLLDKDLDQADKQDLAKLEASIKAIKYRKTETWFYADGSRIGVELWKPIKPITINDYMVITGSFYRWFYKKKEPEVLEEFRPPKVKIERLKPKDILTWEDVIKLSKTGRTPLEVALPQVLFDCGSRAEELLSLHYGDVELIQDNQAAILHFRKSKTEEGLRSPAIVNACPALIRYMQGHPYKTPDTPLWIGPFGKTFSYASLQKLFRSLQERSGIEKPCNPHSFRKSAATAYAHNNAFSVMEVKARFGWTKSSRMLDVYCRIDEDKVNRKVLEEAGLKQREETKEERKKNICGWCGINNPLGADTCSSCLRELGITREEALTRLRWDRFRIKFAEQMFNSDPELNKKAKDALAAMGQAAKP